MLDHHYSGALSQLCAACLPATSMKPRILRASALSGFSLQNSSAQPPVVPDLMTPGAFAEGVPPQRLRLQPCAQGPTLPEDVAILLTCWVDASSRIPSPKAQQLVLEHLLHPHTTSTISAHEQVRQALEEHPWVAQHVRQAFRAISNRMHDSTAHPGMHVRKICTPSMPVPYHSR